MKWLEERLEWHIAEFGEDMRREIKKTRQNFISEMMVTLERKLTRHKLEVDELIQRRLRDANKEMQLMMKEEMNELVERIENSRRRSYFSESVRASVSARERSKWAGTPLGRAMFNSDDSTFNFVEGVWQSSEEERKSSEDSVFESTSTERKTSSTRPTLESYFKKELLTSRPSLLNSSSNSSMEVQVEKKEVRRKLW